MEHKVIVVDSEPYCIWEHNIQEQNKLFLEGIDTEYFEYIVDSHTEDYTDKEKQPPKSDQVRASVVLRSTYHHAMETMFSLLGGLLQSPHCTYAWMIKCKNIELVSVIKRINNQDSDLHHELILDKVSWEEISKTIFHGVELEGRDIEKTSKHFAQLWRKLADEYCDENKTIEYNSIKHGLRTRAGGYTFSLGLNSKDGEPEKKDTNKFIVGSEFGSSFIKLFPFKNEKGNRSLISKTVTLGWNIENIVNQIYLIVCSIKSIVFCLKQINGCDMKNEKFCIPQDDNAFTEAWRQYQMMSNLEMSVETNGKQPIYTTKKQLLEALEKSKKANKRFNLTG